MGGKIHGRRNTFVNVTKKDVPRNEVCINGKFAYAIKHKFVDAGHGKTEACIDNERRLDSRFCVKGFREAIGENDAARASQFRGLGVLIEAISCRKMNFRVAVVSRAFLK